MLLFILAASKASTAEALRMHSQQVGSPAFKNEAGIVLLGL